jgi:citrate synthase
MASGQQMTAAQAAKELAISLATLYAYVSRGLIRSEPSAGATRQRLYRREDVETLKARKELRRNPIQAAERSLSWGLPVLESGLTLISNGQLYYRGFEATGLALTRSVEEVASLMWRGEFGIESTALFARASERLAESPALRLRLPDLPPIERMRAILPVAASGDLAAYDFSPAALVETGARIVVLLTRIAARAIDGAYEGMARTLQRAWAPAASEAAAALRTALILCVDHELAVSSFTARCVASAGSTLYAVVEAALCAFRGWKHGGATERAEELFEEAASSRRPREVLARRLKQGESLPGFGHPLYSDGDPRAQALLKLLMRRYPDSPEIALGRAIIKDARAISPRLRPNIDFAGALFARTLELPAGSAVTIFGLGRTIGWIGHAIEQYQIDHLIRPRARYVGPPPQLERK